MGLMTFNRARRQAAKRRERPRPEPAPMARTASDPRGDYRVEKNGTWYSLIGPDGEKVGASKRSEAEAWAQLEGR